MKIRLLTSRSGPDGVNVAGDVIDVDADEAQRYVESQQAELVDAPKKKSSTKAATKAETAETR